MCICVRAQQENYFDLQLTVLSEERRKRGKLKVSFVRSAALLTHRAEHIVIVLVLVFTFNVFK